ncbi:hypothetical protein ACQY0O_002578 [Thecaphora frezii]
MGSDVHTTQRKAWRCDRLLSVVRRLASQSPHMPDAQTAQTVQTAHQDRSLRLRMRAKRGGKAERSSLSKLCKAHTFGAIW